MRNVKFCPKTVSQDIALEHHILLIPQAKLLNQMLVRKSSTLAIQILTKLKGLRFIFLPQKLVQLLL